MNEICIVVCENRLKGNEAIPNRMSVSCKDKRDKKKKKKNSVSSRQGTLSLMEVRHGGRHVVRNWLSDRMLDQGVLHSVRPNST